MRGYDDYDEHDPTAIDLSVSNGSVDPDTDPFAQRFAGTTTHGLLQIDVPFISHVDGNLYVGGCTNGLVLPKMFRHVLSLYRWEKYTIAHDDVEVETVTMYDEERGPDGPQILELATKVVDWCEDGPTLVHCQAGLNRSGLVAARALMLMGHTADSAIDLLREKRSPAVLCNRSFESFLLGR